MYRPRFTYRADREASRWVVEDRLGQFGPTEHHSHIAAMLDTQLQNDRYGRLTANEKAFIREYAEVSYDIRATFRHCASFFLPSGRVEHLVAVADRYNAIFYP